MRIGLASGKMAAACDVTADVQTAYEKGRRLPNGRYLLYAAALGADVLYILTGHRQPDLGGGEAAQQLQAIINLWPRLPPTARTALAALLQSLAGETDPQKPGDSA